jgi:tetratricopeptide (TPR) repeat protein
MPRLVPVVVARALVALTLGLGSAACVSHAAPAGGPLAAAAAKHDALAISDALEALIAEGKEAPADRGFAYDAVREREEPTAAYAFARAAITGRLVQAHGLTKSLLIKDAEAWAEKSVALDPNFRDRAATRMLGTLYVLAPAALLAHGDSEKGLDLLEKLVAERPDIPENHLRLAEAYIALGDNAPATPHLCACVAKKERLRKDDQALLQKLLRDAGNVECPATGAATAR